MVTRKSKPQPHSEYHQDGSLWARGSMLDGVPVGYWEWFRKDGTRMRSGTFLDGEQVGEWITYDRQGQMYKVTTFSGNKVRKKS
jgi:antitoxin component YwqK of YwqJK toxin-antitoxin module